jgi:hypothetical protein
MLRQFDAARRIQQLLSFEFGWTGDVLVFAPLPCCVFVPVIGIRDRWMIGAVVWHVVSSRKGQDTRVLQRTSYTALR